MAPFQLHIPSGSEAWRRRRSGPPAAAVRSQLQKLIASQALRGANLLQRFLSYSVEQTLRGDGARLREFRLAIDVFARAASFDPRLDPIVRISAQRLRVRLSDYYAHEGRQDAIRIDIPKGGYAATFAYRGAPAVEIARRALQRRWVHWALLGSCAGLVTLLAVLHRQFSALPVPAAAQPPASSIAVLPIVNLTGDPQAEYLSDGLTDELTAKLGRESGLRVIARTSAFRYKGRTVDVRNIGSELNVRSLLEGSLQRDGKRLRITVQLVRASDGSHVWAQTYDYDASDIFTVEDRVSAAIAGVLQAKLAADGPVKSRQPASPAAFDLYLRGRYWLNRRTPPDVWQSIAWFNRALLRDPAYAEAYVGLADGYAVLGFNDQASGAEVVPQARAAALRALQLDDSLGEAHAVLAATIYFHEWDAARAEQEFRRAIRLDPNIATAHQWYGVLLMSQRRYPEAIAQFTVARQLDPLSLLLELDIGEVHYYAGRQQAAIGQAERVLRQDPGFAMAHDLLGMAYERQQRFAEAVREFRAYARLSGGDPDALTRLALALAHSGQRQRAVALVGELQRGRGGGYVSAYDIAALYAALGDADRSFAWLHRAIDQRASSCLLLAIDPAFEVLHADRRFRAALARVSSAR